MLRMIGMKDRKEGFMYQTHPILNIQAVHNMTPHHGTHDEIEESFLESYSGINLHLLASDGELYHGPIQLRPCIRVGLTEE